MSWSSLIHGDPTSQLTGSNGSAVNGLVLDATVNLQRSCGNDLVKAIFVACGVHNIRHVVLMLQTIFYDLIILSSYRICCIINQLHIAGNPVMMFDMMYLFCLFCSNGLFYLPLTRVLVLQVGPAAGLSPQSTL